MIFKLIFLLSEKCVFIKNNNNCYYLVLFEKSDSMRYINHFLKIYFFLLINKYFQKCLLPDECYFWLLKFLFIYFPLFKLKYKKSILCGQSAWKYHCFINIYLYIAFWYLLAIKDKQVFSGADWGWEASWPDLFFQNSVVFFSFF